MKRALPPWVTPNSAWSRTGVLLASCCLAAIVAGVAHADGPPVPDLFRPYGVAQTAGSNIAPEEQPVVAFLHDTNCGVGQTLIALPDIDTPPADVGKTVYALDVLADGDGPGQRPGCGHPGDPVTLYFPALHALATPKPLFAAETARVDVEVGAPLPFSLQTALLANDGTP